MFAQDLVLLGPHRKAAYAVSAYVIWGVLVRRQSTWDERTRMCTQCEQMMPIMIVPIPPKSNPPFLIACGIARIPVPSEDLRRCVSAPRSLKRMIT